MKRQVVRGFCTIKDCLGLQRKQYGGGFGKYCEKHHKDPVLSHIRREARRKTFAERKEARRLSKLAITQPAFCSVCGTTISNPKINLKFRICESCKKTRGKLRRYGVDKTWLKATVLSQNGCCSICGEKTEKLVIDHCHSTNIVRGLLCGRCNTGLGQFRDDLDILASASSYLINSRVKREAV
jgi:hypothetical protein